MIHDPSGCNSTYNTHDEPRWYDKDSLIFISGLSEIDAIMGSDDKLICDISRAARQLSPRFIALVQTPVPLMTGVDFYGIRDILEMETGLPVFFFPTSGMHSYVQGAGMALAAVAKYMVDDVDQAGRAGKQEAADIKKKADHKIKFNLLGVTPLDFSINSTLSSVINILEDHDFQLLSCFAVGSDPQEIARAGEADVNLVVSSVGLEAAKVLSKRFATPYVVGLPCGAFANVIMEDMKKCIQTGSNIISYRSGKNSWNKISTNDTSKKPKCSYIIGEAVAAQSIREAVRMEYGMDLKVLCYLETPAELLDEQSLYLTCEDEIKAALLEADEVIADPMYQPICPPKAHFIPFPHEAFSGRIYRTKIPDLTKPIEILKNR